MRQLISFAIALALTAVSVALHAQQPRVFLLDAKLLTEVKALPATDPAKQNILSLATADADRALHEGPFAVTSKEVIPPSGDKHDYMSQAPYFWPDPSKPDGKPYLRKDGQRNPEIRKITDHDAFGQLGEASRALALGYYFTGKQEYADRVALLIRTWFLDPSTRMNPNLEFGQGIPGINTGRGIGIIESRSLTQVVDAVGLIAKSPSWSSADQHELERWYSQYLHWMRSSQKGQDEDSAKNNHGTWYDLQLTDYALFLGDRDLARSIVERARTKRIQLQIEPDGREPLELARTRAFGYSEGNLDGLMQLATLGRQIGVDLWNFHTSDGRSMLAALNYLLPFALGQKPWLYQQITGFQGDMLLHCTERAALATQDELYIAAALQLGGNRNDLDFALFRFAVAHR
ncbi:MAG TPA: alginate lyase family protein [Bryocella sp.]|nr:alginate lyase family protein [Bryocella sp.]